MFNLCVAWVATGNGFSRRTIFRGPRPPLTRWPQRAKRSPSAATLSKVHPPPSRPTKVQPTVPKSKVSSIQAISALGVCPDPAVLASLQEALQKAKESSSPSTHVQAEPGKSPDARVAEAQARVSRLQAALDLLGAHNPDGELLKASLETAKRQCRARGRTSGFLDRRKCQGSAATLDQVRISVGRRVGKIWNGCEQRSGTVEEGAERMVGKAQFPVHGRCWGFSVFPDGRFDRRSRRQAPLSRACAIRHQALWFRDRHSKYGLRGVKVGEASHPGPAGSRYFALTEVDSDAEDEDSNSHISEVCPLERSGRRRLVILGGQTQEDPVDTVFDEDFEVGSDHSSDTESIDTQGGTSDAAGEAEVVSLLEAPVPTVSVPVERFTDSFQWLAEVDLDVVFKQRPCLM